MVATPLRRNANGSACAINVLAFVFCAVVLIACSSEEPPPVAEAPPPIDPRYASAEALIDHFNALNADPNASYRNEYDLYFAENSLQKRILASMEYVVLADDLEQASREQFGEPFDPSRSLMAETAQITSIDGRRAIAKATVIATGEMRDLHLVELDGRWWLSGYTFEYDEDMTDPESIEFYEEVTRGARQTIPALVARIRSGEFPTLKKAREVIIVEAMTDALREFGEMNGDQ